MAKIVDLGTVGRRWVFALCFVYFHVNVLTVYSAEKNFWAERRESAKRLAGVSPLRSGADPRISAEGMAETGLSSGRKAPFGLSTEQFQLLAQLTRAGQFDFGVSQSGSVGSGLSLDPASFQVKEGSPSTTNLLASTAQTSKKISSLILPYGSISEIHLSKKSSAPMVIHIQDAHGIEEAQKNMASIIRGLNDSGGVTLVGLEGASGKFDLDPYRGPDAFVAKDIADYFLKEGKIAGPEYVGLTAPQLPVLFGVEDANLYLGNVKALRNALKEKSAMTKILFDLKSSIVPLKDTLYSKELKEYDQHFHSYQEQKEGLGAYVRYLLGAYGEARNHFPNLSLLLQALDSEDALDFKRVEKDRQELVERLAKGLSQARINLLVERSLQYRSGQLGFGDYHRFLLALCRENKIAIEDLKQMRAYIDYVLLAERIDRNKLLDELSRLEQETQNRLADTINQKRLVSVSRRLALLDKLAAQAMTPADWVAYQSQKVGILKVVADINALDGKTNAILTPELLASPEDFCRIAIDRNAAFIDNMAEQIQKQKASSAILVAGGFHTEGLTRLLRAKDFSYAVVTPKITEVPKTHNYLDVFARDPLPLEKLFSGERLFLKYPSPMGPAQDGFHGAHDQFGRQVLVFQLAVMLQKGTGAIKDLLQRVIADAQKLKLNFTVNNVEQTAGEARFVVDMDGNDTPDLSVKSTRAGPTAQPRDESSVRVGETQISIQKVRPTLAARVARGFKNIRWGKWATSLLSPLKFLTRRSNAFWVESVLIGAVFVVTQVGAFSLSSIIFGGMLFFFVHTDTWRQIRVLGRKTSTQQEKQEARKRLSSRFVGSFLVVGIVFIFLDPSLIPALSEISKTASVRPIMTALGFSPALAIGLLVSAGVHYMWNKVLVPRGAGALSIFDAKDDNLGGNPYIYDPIMRKTIIAQMATREAYLDPKEEYGVLYREIQEVFQDVLKAAHDRLLREGKNKQAESILQADLFLADNMSINAYGMIYFNFVAINTGLLMMLNKNNVLSKDTIAFILAHEVTHLLQYQEAVDAGKVEPGLSFSNLDDLIKKKFHDKVNLYAQEQDADVRAVDLVNAAGYNVSEITTFFDVVSQPAMKFLVLDLFSNHPENSERSAYLRRTRLKGNWTSVAVPQSFSDGAIGELNGSRGKLRLFQEAVWKVTNFDEAMKLTENAGSLDALAPIATWALQRVLKLRAEELISNSINETIPSELQERLNTLMKEINASDSYPFGFVVRDPSLWDQDSLDLKIERDPKRFTVFCLTVYLATGRMPDINEIPDNENEKQLNSLVEKMKGAFDENQSIQSIILKKDQLKIKILEQAAVLTSKGDSSATLQIELLFEKKNESAVDLNKWLAGLSSLPEEKLLDYLRKIKPVQSWSTENFIGEESLFLSRLKSFRELHMSNLVREVLQLLVKNNAGQSVSKQLELLMFIKEKESELPAVYFDVGGFLMRLARSAKFLRAREKSEVVDFIIRHPEFHSNRYVCDFLYSWWVKNKHSKKITKAMESSPVLRKYMFESYLRAFDSDLNMRTLLFKDDLLRGEVDKIIKLFKPSELALKLFAESVQKLKPNAEFVEGLTHWRRVAESAYRYGANWVSSQGSYLDRLHLWALLDYHQNQTINEAQSLLTKAGFNMEGRSVCHEIARLIVFFEAGGLEDPASFRNMIETLLKDDNINNDDLAVLAKFLNSDYMYELQEKRKMPSLFSLNNVSVNAMGKEIIISFGRPSPEQGIVDREFYRSQTWGEYIARFNVLVHMRVTGQAKEYQQLMDIDNSPDLFSGFAGELNDSDMDSYYEFEDWNQNIFEIRNKASLSEKVKKRFTELFEKVFQQLIWSSPKYVDRRDLSDSLERGWPFEYIYNSPRTAQELVFEAKAFLPKSVYRNYWFLHLLARQLHEIDPTFDISHPLDLVQIRKHLKEAHRKGINLELFYETLDKVIPLLVRDVRMESINEGLLSFWALKRAGNKSGGIGDPIGDKSHSGKWIRLIDFKTPKNFSDSMSWWKKFLIEIGWAYSDIRHVFFVIFQFVNDFYQVIAPLVMLYFFRYWFSLGIAPKLLVLMSNNLIKTRSIHTILHDGDHRLPVFIANHLMESLLKALHKESGAMKFLRAVLLGVNCRIRPTGHVDFFHFDYQGKQTQLDTGLAGLAESRTEAELVSSRDFQEKIDSLLKRYPRPSPARDRFLEILAGHETSRLNGKNPGELLLNLNVLRGLFANEYFIEKLGFQAFELERGLRPDLYQWEPSRESLSNVGQLHFDFVERNVALVKKYFQPGYFRDDVLLAILEESWTQREYALIEPLLYQYKGGLLMDEKAAKTSYIEDKMKLFLEDATAVDKKDFLLWVLGAKGKPLFLQEWEYYFGINMDRVRGIFLERGATAEGGLNFERVGESAKKELIRQMFAGEGGLLESPAVFESFMNNMFDHVVPRRGKVPREKLRTILRVILKNSDDNRRVQIVQSLAVNMADALAGESLDQNQVIAKFFESLGLVGVKMAQTLAHSYDVELDKALRESLATLSSRADPLSKMVVFETIEKMYLGEFEENFNYVKNSLGSASVKIVYRARRTGTKEDIALKVKRPEVDQSLAADLTFLAGVLGDLREKGFSIPVGLEKRISGAISEDADFKREAQITGRFEEEMARMGTYALKNGTPIDFEIAPIYVVKRTVMETGLAAGISLDREGQIISRGIATLDELREVKKSVFDMLMGQVFREGFYLADPHGGNFHLARVDGRLKVIFIDSGSAEEVALEKRQELLEAMMWLAVNPGRTIPQEYLYTSVFFAKLGYLREGISQEEMLEIIFKYMEVKDGEHVLTPKEYLAKIRARFAAKMSFGEKLDYLWRKFKSRSFVPLSGRPTSGTPDPFSDPQGVSGTSSQVGGIERREVPIPSGMPQNVNLSEVDVIVGESRPIDFEARFRGIVGAPNTEPLGRNMVSYFRDLEIMGVAADGVEAISAAKEEDLSEGFVKAMHVADIHVIGANLLSMIRGMLLSESLQNREQVESVIAGVALLHAKGSAFLAQANGRGPRGLAELRIAQAEDIHLLVQLAASVGVTDAEALQALFKRYYDGTLKKVESLARYEAKGAEEAQLKTNEILAVNLEGLSEKERVAAMSYVVGAARARQNSEGSANVAVVGKNLDIGALSGTYPRLGAVSGKVTIVTETQQNGLYSIEGQLSVKTLLRRLDVQPGSSLDVVSNGSESVLQDQGSDLNIIVRVRDFFSIGQSIREEMLRLTFVLLQA